MAAKSTRKKPTKRTKKTPLVQERSFGEIISSVGADWVISGLSIDAEVFQNYISLLMLSREAWRTNPIFVKYAEQINANCFGANGIMMRSKVKETEDRVVYSAEEKWALIEYEQRINGVREWACRINGRPFTRESQYRAMKLADEMERSSSDAIIRGRATVQVGAPDVYANQMIEGWWNEWQRAEFCDSRGRRDYGTLRQIRLWGAARDGGHFIRLIRDTKVNRFGFALQQINDEWVDPFYNVTITRGQQMQDGTVASEDRVIRMGIEYPFTPWGIGKPIAFHFIKQLPRSWQTGGRYGAQYHGNSAEQRTRVPASEVIHYARFSDIEQTRPAPWGVSIFGKARHLDQAELAAVVAARAEACKTGFLYSDLLPEGGTTVGEPPKMPSNTCISDTARSIRLQPGGMYGLPWGVKFQPNDPTHPSGDFPAFRQSEGQAICQGLPGADYNVVFNDLNMSFSSGRVGRLDTSDVTQVLQEFDIKTAERPIFEAGLEMALITGEIPISFSAQKYKKLNKPRFDGRRRKGIDEVKDATAAALRIANGMSSWSKECADAGDDFDDVVFQKAEDLMMMHELGMDSTLTVQKAAAKESGKSGKEDSDSTEEQSSPTTQDDDEHDPTI